MRSDNMTAQEAIAACRTDEIQKAKEWLHGEPSEPSGTRMTLCFPEKTELSSISDIYGHAPQVGDEFIISTHGIDPDANSNFHGRGRWRITCIRIHASFCYRTTDGMRERESHTLCLMHESPNVKIVKAQAIVDAIMWSRNILSRHKALFDDETVFLGCIKISPCVISQMGEDGEIRPATLDAFPFFEWKYDWLGTLDEILADSRELLRKVADESELVSVET